MRGTKDNLLFATNGHNILKNFSPTPKYLFNIFNIFNYLQGDLHSSAETDNKTWSYLININGRTTMLFLLILYIHVHVLFYSLLRT